MAEITVTELGCPGHFIAARSCHWKRHTQVGLCYRISSVGDYRPPDRRTRERVGCGEHDYYETMVFRTSDAQDRDNDGCGCHAVESWSGLECHRYATPGEAQAGHEAMVAKYRALAAAEAAVSV